MPAELQPDYPDPNFGTRDPKRRYLCRHIHASGQRCGSPAVRGHNFCYYHGTARRGFPAPYGKAGDSAGYHFEFPHIDTRADIQLALFQVLTRIATNDVDTKRASLLLYGLQIASANLPRARHDEAAIAHSIEHIDHTYSQGDLAPVQELPDPEPEPMSEAPLSKHCHSEPQAKNLCIPPEAAKTSAPTPDAVILSEARSAQSKDPDAFDPPTIANPVPPGPAAPTNNEERTTNNLQPVTCNPQPPLTLCAAAEFPQDFPTPNAIFRDTLGPKYGGRGRSREIPPHRPIPQTWTSNPNHRCYR